MTCFPLCASIGLIKVANIRIRIRISSSVRVVVALVILLMIGETRTASCVLLVGTEPSLLRITMLLSVWNVVEQCIILTFSFVHKD